MIQNLQKHKQACVLLAVALLAVAVVCVFGRITFRNELTRDIREHVFLGYLDDGHYGDVVEVPASALPDWCALTQADLRAGAEENKNGAESAPLDVYVVACTKEAPRIGIFADVTALELRVEDRRWLDGKLMQGNREYYCKVRDHVSLEPCADGLTPEIAPEEIRNADYGGITYQSD